MTKITNPLTCQSFQPQRLLGNYSSDQNGPLLIVLTCLHGNEPSGLFGFQKVLCDLHESQPKFRGEVVGICCNLPALAADKRYIKVDMNRLWTEENINGWRRGETPKNSEEAQLAEVTQVIDEVSAGYEEKFFLDCHTTSSESVPFVSLRPTITNAHLVSDIPVHAVLGAGTHLNGISDAWLVNEGFSGFTFEAGQHDELASIEAQEAMIWTMLKRCNCIDSPPEYAFSRLAKSQLDGCHHFEIDHIHRTSPDGNFTMCPGFFNFKKIHPGELLAWEHGEPIHSKWDARIFMPLYQPLGDEGFSIIHEID